MQKRWSRPSPRISLFLVLLVVGCVVSAVSGPSSGSAGSNVTFNVTFDNTLNGVDGTAYVVADVPIGWSLNSASYSGTVDGAPVSGTPDTTPTLACSANLVPPGFQRFYFSAGPFPVVTDQDQAVLAVNFTIGSTAGNFDLSFAGSGSVGQGPPSNTCTAVVHPFTVTAATNVSLAKQLATTAPIFAGTDATFRLTATTTGGNAADLAISDMLPAGTTFVNATAAGAVCTTPAAGSAGTVTCTWAGPTTAGQPRPLDLTLHVAPGTAAGTVITNNGTVTTSSSETTTSDNSASATLVVSGTPNLTATKVAGGSFIPFTNVSYAIVITNSGTATQPDNIGDEFTDVLPSSLRLLSASSTSGTVNADTAGNTVHWNGALAPGATATVNISANILGQSGLVTNQGTLFYDSDRDGNNESSRPTDDPAAIGSSDPTTFQIATTVAVPTLSEFSLILIGLFLSMAAIVAIKPR